MHDEALDIKKIVEEMKLYEKPEDVEKTRSLIRKNVPLSMRGYLLAYLYILLKQKPKKQNTSDNNVSLYINIGKINKTNPKELVAFIEEKTSVDSRQIHGIVLKQNFSFINADNSIAEKIISTLNGKEFHGRKIKINYSNDKKSS